MEKVYVQTYSVCAEPESLPEKLEKLASIGYSGVEFAGYGGLNAKEMKKALADAGLVCVSSHVGMDNIIQDLEYLAELGAKMCIRDSQYTFGISQILLTDQDCWSVHQEQLCSYFDNMPC